MSLKFLSKKSWHTTNIKNVEKVWIAEETAAKEQKKLAELQKQIQEERQIQELRELQVASGQVVRNTDTTMDWMYEGPAAQQQQFGEEYLLGKVYKPENDSNGTAGVDLRREKDPGSLWMNKVNAKNDSFTRLHEDPLLSIRKQEKTVREDIIHNPVKMARIKHRIAEDLAKLENKKSKKEKKSHKEQKSHKHHKKESKRSRSERHSRSRSRSRSSGSEERSRHARRRRTSSSRSRSAERDRDSRRHKRPRSRSPEDRSRRRDRSRDSRDRDKSPRRDSHRRGRDDDDKCSGGKSYGLIRKGGVSESGGKQTGSLGPDIELLRKKEAADAEKNDWRKRLNKDGVKRLTEEEKQQRLAQMERDALISEERRKRSKRLPSDSNTEEKLADGGPSAEFIKSMRSEVYNNDLDSSAAMEDRMKRNRHYQQSSSDFDKGFMKT